LFLFFFSQIYRRLHFFYFKKKKKKKKKQTVPLDPMVDLNTTMNRPGACIDFHVTYKPILPKVINTPSGILVVEVISAHELKAVDFRGKSDPYVKLTIPGNEAKQTSIKLSTLNPKWEPPERFDFVVCDSSTSTLMIDVLDQDNVLLETGRSLTGGRAAKLIGRAEQDVSEVASMLDPLDKTFALKDGDGILSLRMWWYSTGSAVRSS
jgi:Ca2+-dependent lipid-binding protein